MKIVIVRYNAVMGKKLIFLSIASLVAITIIMGLSLFFYTGEEVSPQEYATLQELAFPKKTDSSTELPAIFTNIIDREPLLLRAEDLKDASGFMQKLSEGRDALSQSIRSQCTAETQRLLTEYEHNTPVGDNLKKAVVTDLNQLLQKDSLYTAERFQHIELSKESKLLTTQKLEGEDLIKCNRLLLAEAYPQEIMPYGKTIPQLKRKPGQDRFQIFAFLLALLGTPLFAIMGSIGLFITNNIPSFFVNILDKLTSSSLFVTLPLFTFAGFILSESKAPQRLVRFSQAFLGWLPGGSALIAIVTCAFFTAFTGASGVTIIAVGGLLYPLLKQDHSEKFNLGLITSSGSLGLLFPPSLPLILYAVIATNSLQGLQGYEVPIKDLFLAGVLPGVLMMVVLGGYGIASGVTQGDKTQPFSWKELRNATVIALPELLIPILLGIGFFGGYLDVEESSAMTAGYVLVIEAFLYREISWRNIVGIVKRSMVLFGAILVVLMMAIGVTTEVIMANIPEYILAQIQQHIQSKFTFLLLLNVFLLIVGGMMDIFSAILVVVPLIVPIAVQYGVNPLHLGIIFLVNLEIGYSTPPVGMNLFIASLRFKQSIWFLFRAVIPFLFLRLGLLLAITFYEGISLWMVVQPARVLWLLLLFPALLLWPAAHKVYVLCRPTAR